MSLPLANIFTDIPEAIIVFFHDTVGLSWGLSIVALTFAVRLAIMPLSISQIKGMRRMQELQPQLKHIQDKFKDDKQKQQQEMMRIYQENGVNPLASCFPLLLQIPVFIALFYMLRGESFRCDVRENVDPSLLTDGCRLVDNAPIPADEGFLFIESILLKPSGGELYALMFLFVATQLAATLVTMARGQTLEGPMKYIPFMLPVIGLIFVPQFEAGLSVYWISTNVWTFGQQQIVMQIAPPPPKKTQEEVEAEYQASKPPPPPPRKKKKKKGGRRR